MNRQDAEKIITEYLKPIFGFALKRCKNSQDAEDLSQDIVLKAFRALLIKDDIGDVSKFIWTIAHNALSNYYRDAAKSVIGMSIDEVAEVTADPDSIFDDDNNADILRRLQSEIAYLSKLQRKIVIAYYFENRKQADIAKDLNIPLGTVKWHLFEAKKELKRGMDTVRKTSELKFNPVKFHSFGINGSAGTKNLNEFFRSTLSQNICYCVRNEAKTVGEIADALGVSPVYVETEVDFYEKYGFLKEENGKYIVNFIISEPSEELLITQDTMYKKAATLFANELYDELMASGLLRHPDILYDQTDGALTLTESPQKDDNFLLWSLIPYIAARSGENLMDNRISFKEVATLRSDGGHNIAHASVISENMILPDDYVYMKGWCGPMINNCGGQYTLWHIDTEWSSRVGGPGVNPSYDDDACRILSLYQRELEGDLLSKDEYAWLSERGLVKTIGDCNGSFKSAWQTVTLASKDIKNKLLAIGEKIKVKYKEQLDAIKAPYMESALNSVPAHLRRVKEYELQFVFYSEGWFLLHCIVALLNSGKLKLPTEEQRKALTTLIVRN